MEGNKGKVRKCVDRLKKMAGLTGRKKKNGDIGEESVSDVVSCPRAVRCEELYFTSEEQSLDTDHILRAHILAQKYFSQRANVFL